MAALDSICIEYCQQREYCTSTKDKECFSKCRLRLDEAHAKNNQQDLIYITCIAGPGKSVTSMNTCLTTDIFCQNMAASVSKGASAITAAMTTSTAATDQTYK